MMGKFLTKLMSMAISAVSIILVSSTAEAEQAAAEQYRQMFKSGNFYVECQIIGISEKYPANSGLLIYAGKNGNRMQRTTTDAKQKQKVKTKGGPLGLPMFNVSYYMPLMSPSYFWYSELSSLELSDKQYIMDKMSRMVAIQKKKDYPSILYKDGKYYQFVYSASMDVKSSKNNNSVLVIMLPENELNSSRLNPAENWKYAIHDLALPDELAIFYWNDKFRENPFGVTPYYNGSAKRTIEDKEYDCDQYLVDVKSMAGTNVAQEAYNMLYDKGQLVRVQKYLILHGKEQLIRDVIVYKITADVPDDAFNIGSKYKVYAAGMGDMNELLEKRVVVEEIGGEAK